MSASIGRCLLAAHVQDAVCLQSKAYRSVLSLGGMKPEPDLPLDLRSLLRQDGICTRARSDAYHHF